MNALLSEVLDSHGGLARRRTFATLMVLIGILVNLNPASGHDHGAAAPIFGIKIFDGYRDWKLISVAHEAGNLNDIRAILGNDIAIKAYREGRQSFPDGAVIARVAGIMCPPRRTTRHLAGSNPSLRDPPRLGTCSLWSRTQQGMPQPAGGGTLSLTRMATLPMKRSMKLASPVMRLRRIATMLPVTHPDRAGSKQICAALPA